MSGTFFCSQLSLRHGEKIYGTASTGNVWLLLEYPFPWGSKALLESALSQKLKDYLNSFLKRARGSRLLLIKRDRVRHAYISLFVVICRESDPYILKIKLESYDQLLSIDLGALARGDEAVKNIVTCSVLSEPLYLVCTHGRRDKCCAKFGYPLYKYLRKNTEALLWQSSHVGGDRFAANLLCFPHGLFYGHVDHEVGEKVIDEYRRQRMILEFFRGRACYSHSVQSAEFFIRRASSLAGINDLRLIANEGLAKGVWRVRFASPEHWLEAVISSKPSLFATYVTCASDEEKTVLEYSLEDYRTIEPGSE